MTQIAIRIEGLSKQYRIGERQESYSTFRETLNRMATAPFRRLASLKHSPTANGSDAFWALKDISFEIQQGEITGIVGRNGAGKSTLLKILSRITTPTRGYADVYGRVGSLLEVGTGFHPELTGRENILLNGAILGMKRAEIKRKFDDIVDFAGVERFIDTPVKRYSSGMYTRLAFAVAAHLEPDVLMIDEVLAVGDIAFQKKCLGKMEDVAKHGRTVLFVSHNMAAIRSLCTKGVFLDNGQVQHIGPVEESIHAYLHAVGALGSGDHQRQSDHSRSVFGPIIVNEGGSNTVNHDDPLDVSTSLRLDEGVSGFRLDLMLEDMQGNRVVHLLENSQSLDIQKSDRRHHTIRVALPPLWLNPGIYSLHFKVQFWGGFGKPSHLSDTFPLDVQGPNSPRRAVLHPAAEWSIEPACEEASMTVSPQ